MFSITDSALAVSDGQGAARSRSDSELRQCIAQHLVQRLLNVGCRNAQSVLVGDFFCSPAAALCTARTCIKRAPCHKSSLLCR